ncbi:ZIP family zinc transporter [Terrabacter sp. LjRoot27]|uniref:ZIP family metal transporter n=1 Tax=Terrabacter sp. LjRoot27 TaxID=3342306 RepID=UPI003ECE5FCE
MLTATFWGLVGGAALLVGALLGLYARASYRVIGLVMAFGAGVLISAVAFELTEEAFHSAGAAPVVVGLVSGSLVFFAGDWLIDRRGGHRRKSPTGEPQQGAGAMALVLGALLDGIPESAAIGVSVIGGGEVGIAMVAAVFLSNVPESMSASAGLKRAGRSTRQILLLWFVVMLASGLAAGLGYVLLEGASPAVVAGIQTFAAGAIITMLADTMMPEATEHAGRLVGLVTMLGFALAFLLSALG